MRTQVKKWGNSLGIRIPQTIASDLKLHEDSQVELKVNKKQLVIVPKKNDDELSKLLSLVTPQNIHSYTDWGAPVGKEIW